MRLSTTAKIVLEVLTDLPETRDNDYLLWLHTIKRVDPACNTDMSFNHFIVFAKEMGIPQFETVSRARRKVQEQHPELKGTAKVQRAREDLEVDFKEFAREFVC
jgi:hypothetical protein